MPHTSTSCYRDRVPAYDVARLKVLSSSLLHTYHSMYRVKRDTSRCPWLPGAFIILSKMAAYAVKLVPVPICYDVLAMSVSETVRTEWVRMQSNALAALWHVYMLLQYPACPISGIKHASCHAWCMLLQTKKTAAYLNLTSSIFLINFKNVAKVLVYAQWCKSTII